jgi:hypothetical protein
MADDKVKAFFKGVGKAVGEATDRLVLQGRDEAANALFNGSAYWPGEQSVSMYKKPDAPDEGGVHGEMQEPVDHAPQGQSNSVDGYISGYSQDFRDRLNQAAERGGNDQEKGRER